METSGAPAEMTQAERDAFRRRFLIACYRKFGSGNAPEAIGGLVGVGYALAAELGIDPSAADEAYHHWTRRGLISPTMRGGGSLTTAGQDLAEDLLRQIEAEERAEGTPANEGPRPPTARGRAHLTALAAIDAALASLGAIDPYSDSGEDRIKRWWAHVAERLGQSVSGRWARQFRDAYGEIVPGLILSGSEGVAGAVERGRVFLTGLRTDIEASPDMVTVSASPPEMSETGTTEGLHPTIERAARALVQGGHHAQAVLEAAKALVSAVKTRARTPEIDGAHLMRTVFSPKAPLLAFSGLENQSDRDEQEGMMHLYEGAVLAVRNPRAHDPIEDSPEAARRYLALLSFLAYRLEEAAGSE